MKKTDQNVKNKKLSPSAEGTKNFKKITQLLNAKNFSQKTETPFVLIVCSQILDILGFDSIINDNIRWDKDRWAVSPAILARSIILTPFLRDDKRCPLFRIEEAFEGIDLKLLFGENYLRSDFNDDHLAKLLDRIAEAGSTGLFSRIAANSYVNFKIPVSHILHADTTSHVFYGECEVCEQEGYEGLNVTHGHSKDKHPELKQVMTGTLVDEYGIPVYEQTLDGNTSDSTWFKSAIQYLQGLLGDSCGGYTFIADSKLVNKNNIEVIYSDKVPIKFISRCPSNFNSKIAEKTIKQAYLLDNWEDLGICCEDEKSKRAARYSSQGFVKTIYENEFRLIVVKGDDAESKVKKNLKKEAQAIVEDINKSFKVPFSCKPDAEKEIDAFLKKHKNSLFDIKLSVEKIVIEKRLRGRPSKDQKPPIILEKSVVKLDRLTENDERVKKYKQDTESFVLITNVPVDEGNNKKILQDYKKQRVVETNFEELKKPTMVSTIFLEKPERIEALMMLLHVSLLIRVLMRVITRMNLKNESKPPLIDFAGRPLVNPTADKLLRLFSLHSVVTVGDEHIIYSKSGKAEHLCKLLELLGLNPETG
jgi:transposase